MRLAIPICALFSAAAPLIAQEADDTRVGGVGRMACAQVMGPENAPYLGQVGDWALGYMAGRIDAGQAPVEGATLSSADSVDVVAGIALRCREDADMPVIDAVRSFAEEVFGETAEGGPVTADPPPPRPDVPLEVSGAVIDEVPRPRARPQLVSVETESENPGSADESTQDTEPDTADVSSVTTDEEPEADDTE